MKKIRQKGEYHAILQRTSRQGQSEHTSSISPLALTLFILITALLWLSFTPVYLVLLVAAWGKSYQLTRDLFSYPAVVILFLTSLLFVMLSPIAPKQWGEVISWTWTLFEDLVGRSVVYFHSACRGISSNKKFHKIIGFVVVFIYLGFIIFFLNLTIHLLASVELSEKSMHSISSPSLTAVLFALGALVTSSLTILLCRFGFSHKWRMIFQKPNCTIGLLVQALDKTRYQEVRLLHASDFHITDSDDTPVIEGHLTVPLSVVSRVFTAIEADAEGCSAILMTGDITDNGSLDSWNRFVMTLSDSMRKKIIILPGNHDLNIQDRRGVLKGERSDGLGRRMRRLRALCVMTEIMGDRAYVMDRNTRRHIKLEDYFERNLISIEAHLTEGKIARKSVQEIWNGLFPMVALIPETKLGVLILDSTKPASFGLTNAIGAIPGEVIDACAELMSAVSDCCTSFAVALHHHIATPYGGTFKERAVNAGLVFENASELVAMLAKRGDPTVVFHGHRHEQYVGNIEDSDIAIVASPSATIGGRGAIGSWRIIDLLIADSECRLMAEPAYRSLDVRS